MITDIVLPYLPSQVKAELCRRKLSYFVKEFWDIIVPNELVWSAHLDVMCDEMQEGLERVFLRLPKKYDLIYNVPPGTSKTTVLSIMACSWAFSRMPEIKYFVGSYSDNAILGISDNIRIIMGSDKYIAYFPGTVIRKNKNTAHNFKTTKNGEFYAFTVGGSITSKHADVLDIDDPLNPKQAASPANLITANTFFDKTLPSRKVDKEVTLTVLVMQRLAVNDPTGHLLNKGRSNIRHICLPAELADNVSPPEYRGIYIDGLLDPKRLSRQVLSDAKIDLLEDGYAGQMMQRPVKEGGLIWTKCFREIDDNIFPRVSDMTSVGNDWDLAYTDKDTNAASAYFSTGKIDGYTYIFDFDFRYLEFPELIDWMATKPHMHFIEDKGPGKSAKQTLSRNGIIAMEVKVPGGSDKISRAKQASASAKSGMVFIKKSLADRLYNDSQQGILNFPKSPKKDVADALAQALLRQSSRPRIVSTGRKSFLDAIE